jgi:hypothetical protein
MTGRVQTVPTTRSCGRCGYSRTYRTPAMAAHHFRKHRCEKHRRAAEVHARGLARHASVDRTPKPCLHPVARHEHGTYACYTLDKCRCLPCSAASGEYERNRLKQHAYGRYDALVPAEPVRTHVRTLMAAGLGAKRIPVLAGVPVSTVNQLVFGKLRNDGTTRPIERIKRGNAERLLRLRPSPELLAGGALVDATGTQRRLQALICIGWSQSELGRRLGILPTNMACTMRRPKVSVATARAAVRLYDQLWNCPPPETCHRERNVASRARNFARRNGWAPPLAWDEDTLDDPTAAPVLDVEPIGDLDQVLDEVLVERLVAGALRLPSHDRSPELVEAVRRLVAASHSDGVIAERLGRTRDAIFKIRTRKAIPTPAAERSGPPQPIDGIAACAGASEAATETATRRQPAA